jgi:hypothetical protein
VAPKGALSVSEALDEVDGRVVGIEAQPRFQRAPRGDPLVRSFLTEFGNLPRERLAVFGRPAICDGLADE